MNAHSPIHRRRVWGLLALLLLAALVLGSNLPGLASPLPQDNAPFETLSLPSAALSWDVDLLGGERISRNPKLDAHLAGLAIATEKSPQAALAVAESQSLRLSGDRVHVQVVTDAAGLQGAIDAVTRAGGEVTGVGNDATLIQGWLPINALETVSADDNVLFIRRPAELHLLQNAPAGNATTEGLAVINSPAWHAAGHRGAGVKIGVIDGGFLGHNSLLGVDLPASVTVKNFVDGETDAQVDGTTKHGAACAEIIHDIAPDAALYLAKVSTNLDLQEAVAWLKDTHQVDIISTSLVWYNLTPGDGTGEFADLVQAARNAGILWITSAGNDRETHWGGRYYDPQNKGTHYYNATQNVNFFGPGDGNAYNIPAGYRVSVFLRWDDWTVVNQDYDLILLRWSGSTWTVVARGENFQNGGPGQSPTEYVTAVTSGGATAYGFGIARFNSNRAVNFELFAPAPGGRLDEILYARSLGNLADAPEALTVAALDVAAPYHQEPYSSEGPTNGLGGAETGGFTKPDIAGFANVSTVSYGVTDKFAGTSAAVPHVAGAAALVLSAYPAYSPAQVQTFLEERVVDMGPVGEDTHYGHGQLHLGAPPSMAATPTSTVTPTITPTDTPTATHTPTPTTTLTPTGNMVYLPLVLKLGPPASPTPTSTPTRTPTATPTPTPTATRQPGAEAYRFVTLWGLRLPLRITFDFDGPVGVAVDPAGNIYVADTGHNRIEMFGADGRPATGWGSAGSGAGEFNSPEGIAVDAAGHVYVVDWPNDRVQKFTSGGAFVTQWGSSGAAQGQFAGPRGIAVDQDGDIYVADTGNNRIQKFNANGMFIAAWGSGGQGESQFQFPRNLAVDSAGHVYVVDAYNARIQKFTAEGAFVTMWGDLGTADGQFRSPRDIAIAQDGAIYVVDGNNRRIQVFTPDGEFVRKWGSSGAGDGQLNEPAGIAVAADGSVYVADTGNDRIQKFSSDGAFLGTWGQASTGSNTTYYDSHGRPSYTVNAFGALLKRWTYDGVKLVQTLAYPTEPPAELHKQAVAAISADGEGQIHAAVTDLGDRCVQTFGTNGEWVSERCGGRPDSSDTLWALRSVATGPNNHVYIVDNYCLTPYNHQGWPMGTWTYFRVRQFDIAGIVVAEWSQLYSGDVSSAASIAVDQQGRVYLAVAKKHTVWRFAPDLSEISWGGEGTGDGQFSHLRGIAVAPDGSVYVADSGNSRIQKFTADGVFVAQWGSPGAGAGQFNGPRGIAVDQYGAVYVTEVGGNRVQKFTSAGVFITQWGSPGTGEGEFSGPGGIAVDGDGYVYVLDSGNKRIQKFESY